MCGIFGYVGSPERAELLDLQTAIHALRHRGPDGNGTFRGRRGDVAVALAHTRLAIIDLSPLANQPMTTEDGRYTLTYNGEIYNFTEIRAELETEGRRFRSSSDTEVVLQAYAAWGKRCVHRLRGMFSFAVWDAREGSLFFCRDHLGIKPLYYRLDRQGFAFSSEVRALLAAGLAQRSLSAEGLRSYLTWGSVADPLTLVDGVLSLEPAHCGYWKDGSLTIERFWDLPNEAPRDVTFEEAVEEIRPILRDSIARELVSDVPLGVFLSGGIDSSAIVAIASESSPRPIHTFTVTFDESRYDESKFAREIATRFGSVHSEVFLNAGKAIAELDVAVASYDQPSADGINTWFVAKAAREAGLSVALSGLGGDEVFAGYPNFEKFQRLRNLGASTRPLAPIIARMVGASNLNGSSMRLKKLAEVIRAGGDTTQTYRALRCMFTEGQVENLMADFGVQTGAGESNSDFTYTQANTSTTCPVAEYSRLELSNYLRNTLLRDSDQMSMAHSLEVRVPLLDHVLIEKVIPFSARVKLRDRSVDTRRNNKPLLTEATGNIPRMVTARTKAGFVLPFDQWRRDSADGDLQLGASRSMALASLEAWAAANGFSLNRRKTVPRARARR